MLDLLHDIKNNAAVFSGMQQFLAKQQPPVLVATGANDEIFPEPVVRRVLDDLPAAEYHALPTGHFALEDHAPEIAALIRGFLRLLTLVGWRPALRSVPPCSTCARSRSAAGTSPATPRACAGPGSRAWSTPPSPAAATSRPKKPRTCSGT